jgi:hypothetical protein
MFVLTEEYKIKLEKAHKEPNFIDGSGKTSSQLLNELLASFVKSEDVARIQCDAFCKVLSEARIGVDAWDIFVDKIDFDGDGETYRNAFVSEVYKNEPDAERHNEAWRYNQFWAGRDFGHVAPDWERLIRMGVSGIIEDAKARMDGATAKSQAFYQTVIDAYTALKNLILRFESYVDKTTDNGKMLSRCLLNIAQNPPQTLYEVLQLQLIFYRVETSVERDFVRSMGQLDALWEKFYERDLENGVEHNDDLIRAFFLRLNAMKVVANVPFALGGATEYREASCTDFTRRLSIFTHRLAWRR